jgi:hypothetical protein
MADKITFHARNRDFNFSGDLKESIFGKKLMPMSAPRAWFSGEVQKEHDQFNEYNANNYLYRGPDFEPGVDILAVGCSMTYGLGVPESGTWPSILANNLGLTYANLSMTGAGAEWIVDAIYRYIETFGPPKKAILVLMADLFRFDVVYNGVDVAPMSSSTRDFIPKYMSRDGSMGKVTLLDMPESFPKIQKRPYLAEYTRIPEDTIARSIKELRNLERYCKAIGVNLMWGAWSEITIEAMKALDKESEFENYVNLGEYIGNWTSHQNGFDLDNIVDHRLEHDNQSDKCSEQMVNQNRCVCVVDCHSDREKDWDNSFHVAADVYKGNETQNYHFGIHKYIHVAEGFEDYGKERGIF